MQKKLKNFCGTYRDHPAQAPALPGGSFANRPQARKLKRDRPELIAARPQAASCRAVGLGLFGSWPIDRRLRELRELRELRDLWVIWVMHLTVTQMTEGEELRANNAGIGELGFWVIWVIWSSLLNRTGASLHCTMIPIIFISLI